MRGVQSCESLSELTSENVLDSRDLEKLIDELEAEKATAEETPDADDADAVKPEPFPEEKAELLTALIELREEASEWRDGNAFIRESYFKEYAQELADDIGAIDRDAKWPCNCIDWDEAADQLKQDYTVHEIGDVTYYSRS